MANGDGTILVTGATGQQGGAVTRHLLAKGWRVRAMTRNPEQPPAQALAGQGAEVVQGDLYERASVDRALRDVYGVFSVQNFWLPDVGYEGEIRQGKLLADAAKAAGVRHFVYTSVGGAERHTGISHFESKWQIEQHIEALGLPATILRPVFFMDNFSSPMMGPREGALSMPLEPGTALQMIAVDDIGAFAALAFEKPQDWIGKALELAGDALTMPQVAEQMSSASGRPIRYVQQPMEQVRQYSEVNAVMFEWFMEKGYQADIPALRAIYPPLMNFATWLRKVNWRPPG